MSKLHHCLKEKINKIFGLMKYESGGKSNIKYVGLRAKT